jgi:ABC-type multidrug transport system fused ATPase/permease subunit
VALVGRTGSGKSSIVQSLYRLHELEKGSKYFIEGENALEMPLKELRSKFIAISQKPFIFQGTVKENLDPNGKHDDEKIKDALREVKMHDAISSVYLWLYR